LFVTPGRAGADTDIYHIWCDLKPGVNDLEFTAAVRAWLDHLVAGGSLTRYRITRRKLGLAADGLREFHLLLEFENLARLDEAFGEAARRAGPAEGLHAAVYSRVSHVQFALYRDFPDPVRTV
jgi:hypothetical protein